jgi:GntR family transcriptional regulator
LTPGKLVRNPLYVQLKQILKELIQGDEFKPGDKFLTERQISERFDVSRVTANKTLSSLVGEGLLSFRKGIGTFVVDNYQESKFPGIFSSFTNRALAAGKKPSTILLRFEHTFAKTLPPRVRQRFPVDDEEDIIIVERLRLADQNPMILERHYFRCRLLPGITPSEVTTSVYDMVTKKYQQTFSETVETIRTIAIRSQNAELLGVPDGSPGFLMFATPLNEKGVCVYFAELIYRGDSYEVHNRLGPIWRSHSIDEDPGDFEPIRRHTMRSETRQISESG